MQALNKLLCKRHDRGIENYGMISNVQSQRDGEDKHMNISVGLIIKTETLDRPALDAGQLHVDGENRLFEVQLVILPNPNFHVSHRAFSGGPHEGGVCCDELHDDYV